MPEQRIGTMSTADQLIQTLMEKKPKEFGGVADIVSSLLSPNYLKKRKEQISAYETLQDQIITELIKSKLGTAGRIEEERTKQYGQTAENILQGKIPVERQVSEQIPGQPFFATPSGQFMTTPPTEKTTYQPYQPTLEDVEQIRQGKTLTGMRIGKQIGTIGKLAISVTPTAENIASFQRYMPGYNFQVGQPMTVQGSSYDRMLTAIGRQDLDKIRNIYYQWRMKDKGLTDQQIIEGWRKAREFSTDVMLEDIDRDEATQMANDFEPLAKNILEKEKKRRGLGVKSQSQTKSQKIIRVKVKSTGQQGTIPENEFDSKIYDRIP